jgi:hypothetical protein
VIQKGRRLSGKDAWMSICTLSVLLLATPFATELLDLSWRLLPLVRQVGELIERFRAAEPTPHGALQFEQALQDLLRQVGREIVGWVYNSLEAEQAAALPAQIWFEGECYRRRTRTANRKLATLFGVIVLWRFRYEPLEAGLKSIFPLEIRLGIEAARATPALATRVGQWLAQYTQQTVLELLRRDQGVSWAVKTLRKVMASLSAGMAEFRQKAQVEQVLAWLQQAHDSSGAHRPVLSVGRDGVFVPLRKDREYHEGATATVSVLDRSGRRLGTVYLGRMPEPGQTTLSQQLTALLHEVLVGWKGLMPRLEYVTDGGHHQTEYYRQVLKKMADPRRPGHTLDWQWVVDFYHACGYISKIAEALFGVGTRQAGAWSHKMRHWLQHKRHGIFRVLHSAAAHHRLWVLTAEEERAYAKAYAYLRRRIRFMDYAGYRRLGLAIGSGVTEAACKTVFTQRLKQSGMTWSQAGGELVVSLRVIWLSGVWPQVHGAFLAAKPLPQTRTNRAMADTETRKAA